MILFKPIEFTYKRYNAGSFDDSGIWRETGYIEDTARGSFEPLLPSEMVLLPEGRRENESYRIYTDTKLNIINSKNMTNADRVYYEGEEYEVFSCESWKNGFLDHYVAIAILLDINRQ